MSESARTYRWDFITALVIFVGLVLLLAFSLFARGLVGGGPGPRSGIEYNLRQIDGAMGQWAVEHGQTGAVAVTWEDVVPFLRHGFKQVAKEEYRVTRLTASPEAMLTREWTGLPKGTILRLGASNRLEIEVPNQAVE